MVNFIIFRFSGTNYNFFITDIFFTKYNFLQKPILLRIIKLKLLIKWRRKNVFRELKITF